MPAQERVGLVLVEGGGGHVGVGDERRQEPVGAGPGQHLDVQVGERDHRAHGQLGAQVGQGRDVAGVLDPGNGAAVVRGVLRRRQRVGVHRHRGVVLGEGGDDVVALAHPR